MRPKNNEIVIGDTQLDIMQMIFKLKKDAYGGGIYREFADRGERKSLPQIYQALGALEAKKLVEFEFVEGEDNRQGGLRKVYKLTARGSEAMGTALQKRAKAGSKDGWSIPVPGKGVFGGTS